MKLEKKGQKGTSLIEVILAMLLLLVLMISILQMFSMAFSINIAAMARTEMTFKAQQVAENLRYISYRLKEHTTPDGVTVPALAGTELSALQGVLNGIYFDTSTTPARFATTSSSGIDLLSTNGTLSSPDTSFWGHNESNVFEQTDPRFRVNIVITDPDPATDATPLRATITVRANNVNGPRYLASGDRKVVQYVTELPKQ